MQKALLASAAAGSSSTTVVKVEEGVADKNNKLGVLRAAKKKMEQQLSILEDLMATAKASGNKPATEMSERCGKALSTGLSNLRCELAVLDRHTSFAAAENKQADDLISSSEAHTDGAKRVIIKCRTLLT